MRRDGFSRRLIGEGLGCGLIAGLVFGLAVLAAAWLAGETPLMPFKRVASIVLGDLAFIGREGRVVLIGALLHLVLSAVFGLLYAALFIRIARPRLRSHGWQALIGAAYGVGLWFVNFQLIARFAFPALLDFSPWLAALLHAFAFGLPLGLMLASSERVQEVGGAPLPART